MSRLIIFGAGGHAKAVADLACTLGKYEIVGFVDTVDPSRKGESFYGSVVVGGWEDFLNVSDPTREVTFVAIGNCEVRSKLTQELLDRGFQVPSLIHPHAIVSSTCKLGEGVMIGPLAHVGAETRLGQASIINTHANVEHDCFVDEGAHICPGVSVGGGCQIGAHAWIGIGSTLRDKIEIGAGAFVGAGSVVVRSLPAGCLAYGNPAKIKFKNSK